MAVRHICKLFAEPGKVSGSANLKELHKPTLYPAAYPRPGNREKNFLPTGAAALSLKITEFSCDALVIWWAVSNYAATQPDN
jgi:hypothetical protein